MVVALLFGVLVAPFVQCDMISLCKMLMVDMGGKGRLGKVNYVDTNLYVYSVYYVNLNCSGNSES